jgi:mannose-1-phosphate guanylyltransferase
MFVVTRARERYYREDLRSAESSHVIEQPRNRGTGVAIALFQALQVDDDPLVAFFPCDHHYANDYAFGAAAKSALAVAEEFPRSIVLLGADAHYTETEYGCIEPVSMPMGIPTTRNQGADEPWLTLEPLSSRWGGPIRSSNFSVHRFQTRCFILRAWERII